jgi:hypothetical protein
MFISILCGESQDPKHGWLSPSSTIWPPFVASVVSVTEVNLARVPRALEGEVKGGVASKGRVRGGYGVKVAVRG